MKEDGELLLIIDCLILHFRSIRRTVVLKLFSIINLPSGFHQIPTNIKDASKTAFSTHTDHYEFNRMSFGLKTAPVYFSMFYPKFKTTNVLFIKSTKVVKNHLGPSLVHLELQDGILCDS